jgi:hypothetical protein
LANHIFVVSQSEIVVVGERDSHAQYGQIKAAASLPGADGGGGEDDDMLATNWPEIRSGRFWRTSPSPCRAPFWSFIARMSPRDL